MKSNGATGRFKLNNSNEIEVERANGRGFSALATVKPITSAQLATYRGVLGEVVEVTNVAGRPQYRWDGAAFVPMVTAKTDPVTGMIENSADGKTFASSGAFDIRMFGAKSDGKALYDVTTSASTTCTIQSVTGTFTQADVGKACAVIPYSDTGLTPRWGTITAVTSPTSCTASLSASPGALTNAVFVYGTDDTAAVNAALSGAAINGGAILIPIGITCVTAQLIIPLGVTLRGVSNYSTGGRAKDFRYAGSSLVLCKNLGVPFVLGGTGSGSNPRGVGMLDLNIDCLNLAPSAYNGVATCRSETIQRCTILRGTVETLNSSPTSRISNCWIFGQNAGNVVQLSGDASFVNNCVIGAGNGFYQIKVSNPDDILIANNHTWKDGGLPTMLGGQIFASFNSGNVVAGGLTIIGNKFDTSYGPHIYIKASGNSTGRGINIIGNQAMQNDTVPNATYPVIKLETEAGSAIRGLNIHGNIARGSWYDPTKGQYTAFLDASAHAGNLYGSSITGNIADNCAAGYINFTPAYSAGNQVLAGTGTTVTSF